MKESRQLSWLLAELKKAGGSCGVGAGRTDGVVCSCGNARPGAENAWTRVCKTLGEEQPHCHFQRSDFQWDTLPENRVVTLFVTAVFSINTNKANTQKSGSS